MSHLWLKKWLQLYSKATWVQRRQLQVSRQMASPITMLLMTRWDDGKKCEDERLRWSWEKASIVFLGLKLRYLSSLNLSQVEKPRGQTANAAGCLAQSAGQGFCILFRAFPELMSPHQKKGEEEKDKCLCVSVCHSFKNPIPTYPFPLPLPSPPPPFLFDRITPRFWDYPQTHDLPASLSRVLGPQAMPPCLALQEGFIYLFTYLGFIHFQCWESNELCACYLSSPLPLSYTPSAMPVIFIWMLFLKSIPTIFMCNFTEC